MDPTYEVLDKGQEKAPITVEARALCCEQRGRDGGLLLMDYVDEDALCPLPVDLPGQKMIRRTCCGGVVVRREANSGMMSMRIACVKSFCPFEKKKGVAATPEAEEARRAVARRIGLQATECERLKDRCTGYVFRTVASQLGVTSCI
ncbi:hypothetical protein PHYBOEH_004344 [Phytophthora boehmeriae]|uniref:Uncharacterized protein n=1 Tax=Phytophthora boehmeriae TaxID=109152 RepID=A0A8T1XBQ4_9STRA|nr:hypothetical protein PHYBOEH_004344 [Phytophthora boehmeriae]